jgi:hypothetical protein
LFKWLEDHNGKMPQGTFRANGETVPKDKLTEQQLVERNLYQRWKNSPEREALEACKRNIT